MEEQIRENVSKFLKKYRKNRNLTQKQLAEKLGYSTKMISNWEQCVIDMPFDIVLKLREETETPIDEIFGLKFDRAYEDVEDRLFYMCSDYACDQGNMAYMFSIYEGISDEDDLHDCAMNDMYDFLTHIENEGSTINRDEKKVRVKFDKEIMGRNEFTHLVREKYFNPIYNKNKETGVFEIEYEMNFDFFMFIELLRVKKLASEIELMFKENPSAREEMEESYNVLLQIIKEYEDMYGKKIS